MENITQLTQLMVTLVIGKLVFKETFLTKCQKMYNIYETHGEVMTEDLKIRFLFKKIQYSWKQLNLILRLKLQAKLATLQWLIIYLQLFHSCLSIYLEIGI